MSSASKHTDIFKAVKEVVENKKEVNWFVLSELAKLFEETKDILFYFSDGNRTFDLPFKAHQGYLIVRKSVEKAFREGFNNLLNLLSGNLAALSNMYVILSQLSAENEFKRVLLTDFKRITGVQAIDVYNIMIASLNKTYFKHHHYFNKKPLNVQDWLDVFKSSQGFHNITDPVIEAKRLVQDAERLQIEYKWLLEMKPIVRSALMGWYNFEVKADKGELLSIIENSPVEAAFVAASILDDLGPEKSAPEWLDKNVIAVFVHKYWDTIGKEMFEHIYGINFRNRSGNKLCKKLKRLLHEVMMDQLSDTASDHSWVESFGLPATHIAFCNWIIAKKVGFSKIPQVLRHKLAATLVGNLQGVADGFGQYISSENHSDPFNSYNYLDYKYQNSFGWMLLFLLDAPKEVINQLNDTCFSFKPMYYGGYQANHIATRFTEFLLLMVLHIDNLHDLTDEMLDNLQALLTGISHSVLIPYIHLAERSYEIWDIKSDKKTFDHSASKFFINERLKKTINGKYKDNFQAFFNVVNEVKVAKWPYEIA